ncbi:MAG TPA: type II secretion system protein GspG [Pyrinomonadaceae bacterium]|jgi:hypothetical protein
MPPATHHARRLGCAAALLVAVTVGHVNVRAADKTVSRDTARKAIARVGGLELKTGDVRVESISGTGTTAEVAATIKTAFRLRKGAGGRWRVVELRVGDRQWEQIELLLAAWRVAPSAPLLTQLETLVAQFVERERARAAEQEQRKAEEAQADAARTKDERRHKKKEPPAPPPADLRAGPFIVDGFSALLSAATVETRLAMTFRLGRERGAWRVTEARLGDGPWADVAALTRALDAEKAVRARADLQILADALSAFRRERGFYVVADTAAVLVDQLNPRYTTAVVRVDPWHRPYDYKGQRDSFVLRSLGPDGKPDTPDDVTAAHGAQ